MTASDRGSFFALDRRIWAELCERGMNWPVAFLVLACGTGRDNRTTSWSAQALNKYAEIAWNRGKAAIEDSDFINKHSNIHPAIVRSRYCARGCALDLE